GGASKVGAVDGHDVSAGDRPGVRVEARDRGDAAGCQAILQRLQLQACPAKAVPCVPLCWPGGLSLASYPVAPPADGHVMTPCDTETEEALGCCESSRVSNPHQSEDRERVRTRSTISNKK